MAYKLDVFEALKQFDRRNFSYYSGLSDEEKSGFSPVVAMRYLSNVSGELGDWYLLLANQYANPHMFAIKDHPELQMKLMAACGTGQPVRHSWIALPPRKPAFGVLEAFVQETWPGANAKETKLLLGQFEHEEFIDFVERMGFDDTKVKDIVTAYERHYGIEKAKASRKKRKTTG